MPQRLDELLQECTVKITVPGGWGTGFFVAPGLILTCDHVIKALEGDVRAQVRWQQRSLAEAAVVERRPELDLALLQCSPPPDVEVPCVYLGEAFQPQDDLYTYGYPDNFPQGTSVTGKCEGSATENGSELLVFKLAQVRPGLSGAPLLNWRTGRVCGMVKFTKDRSLNLGGGAIPAQVILEQFPQLRDHQRQFHQATRRWHELATKPEDRIDFQSYLQALTTTYHDWWTHYTLTDATGRIAPLEPERASPFDFGLMVQTKVKETDGPGSDPRPEEREKIERLPVLKGIRKYAENHVLLVGRPGSGKSTALIRLLLEDATQALQQSEGQIPVLVELRYWNNSIEGLVQGFLKRHGLMLDDVTLSTLLSQGRFLLLIDGLNELPSESARTQLSAFRRNYPKVPMIFTTRDLRLGGDLGIEKKLEMQPLTEAQMKAFIRAYVPDQAEAMLRQLNTRLREFGQTPLLLWMLCEVFQQSPNRQMPTNLAEVFRAFTTMYEDSSVRKHEVTPLKGDVLPLSDRRLWKEALKALAALMMQGETPVDFRVAIPRTEAERELGKIFAKEKFSAHDILDDLLKYHLLQSRTTDQLEFCHQLIQEYYAAEHLWELLPDLLKDEGKFKRDYLNLLKWTEAISLMLALANDESQALRVARLALDDVDLVLGARLTGEVRPEFQNQLVQYIMSLQISDWFKSRLLSKTRSKSAIPYLTVILEKKDCDSRGNILMELKEFNPDLVIPILAQIFLDEKDPDRITAVEVLNDLGEEPKVMAALGFRPIRIQDIYKLDDINKLDSDFIQLKSGEEHSLAGSETLFNLLGFDDFSVSRTELQKAKNLCLLSTLKEILMESMKDADVISFITALEDQNYGVRYEALRSLFEQESGILNQSVIHALIQALENDSFAVRYKAAEALGAAQDIFFSNIFSRLYGLLLTSFVRESLVALISIQNRCGFYNYEIENSIISVGKTISLYFSYATADKVLQAQLANHLILLEHQGVITSWSSHQILPGEERTQTIHQQLNTADIILLLISAHSLADDTCYHLEIQRAMERHQSGEARVIPVLLRPVDWQSAPFSQLDMLPKNHQPITTWQNQDEAFQEIAASIREIALELRRTASTVG